MTAEQSNPLPDQVAPIDLAEFETRLIVRNLKIEDFDALIALQ